MSSVRTVLLVPRREDGGHRDALWAWCKDRWKRHFPEYPIYEGHHNDGPFNRSAAVNTAARLADQDGKWDFGIVIDSDVFIKVSQLRAAVETARTTGKVTWAHTRWRGFRESWTKRTLDDRREFGAELDRDDMDVFVETTNPISWSCCIVFPRAVWDDLGGFDERFEGWGFEDMALQAAIVGLYGYERLITDPAYAKLPEKFRRPADIYHLFHPRSDERIVPGKPVLTASKEYTVNARLGRRYMVALRRDHGLHDRPGLPSTPAERDRDIANLLRDDKKLDALVSRYGLPDWSDWWPTLEELVEGAKAYKLQRATGSVTVVVHTGGKPENWPTRREYLRKSLASLNENVTGPITQRVIYSDWGSEATDLREIAAEAGFYVAGEGHHGYTGSMRRMWNYLAKRAKGDYIFATEDDFLYPQPVALEPMLATLRDNPFLVQIALLRDAFYQDERETGGILGWPEPAFTKVGENGNTRLEHRLFFTCNPSVFRKSLTSRPWPVGNHSETLFGKSLLNDKRVRFAFWGDRVELTKHIGEVRAGSGY